MNTLQLGEIIAKDAKMNGSVSVFASNQLPNHVIRRPYGFIINTDPSTKPGQHWVAVFLPSLETQPAEFFDSYGATPQANILQFLKMNSVHCNYNNVTLQGLETKTCGYWAIYFLRLRFRNKSLRSIIKSARLLCAKPDCTVYKYINTIYARSIPLPVKRNLYPCQAVCQTCLPRYQCHTQQQ